MKASRECDADLVQTGGDQDFGMAPAQGVYSDLHLAPVRLLAPKGLALPVVHHGRRDGEHE